MKKIIIKFIIGIILLTTGIYILNFTGHKHMSKGFILTIIGFIYSGASGVTLIQYRKYLTKKENQSESLDQGIND